MADLEELAKEGERRAEYLSEVFCNMEKRIAEIEKKQ